MGTLDVASELLAAVLFPGLRVEIVGVEFVEDGFGGKAVRLQLGGEDAPEAVASGRLTATVHVRRVDGDPHEWRRVELGIG
jgi:hypothetical protein